MSFLSWKREARFYVFFARGSYIWHGAEYFIKKSPKIKKKNTKLVAEKSKNFSVLPICEPLDYLYTNIYKKIVIFM